MPDQGVRPQAASAADGEVVNGPTGLCLAATPAAKRVAEASTALSTEVMP